MEEFGAVFYEDSVGEEDRGGPGGAVGYLVGGNGAVVGFPRGKYFQDGVVLENQDVAGESKESGVIAHSGRAEPNCFSRNDVETKKLSPLELRFSVQAVTAYHGRSHVEGDIASVPIFFNGPLPIVQLRLDATDPPAFGAHQEPALIIGRCG